MKATETEFENASWGALIVCTVFALVTLVFCWLMIVLLRSGRMDDAPHPERGYALVALSALAIPGLLGRRKWAAGAFSAVCAVTGTWLIIGSLARVSWPFVLINVALGAALWLPAALTRTYWAALRWRGRLGV